MPVGRILYFNPENDLALASGNPGYTPPAAAVALKESGALLPLWLADDGDMVLVEPHQLEPARALARQYALPGKVVSSLRGVAGEFASWGWSRAAARIYQSAGLSGRYIPDSSRLEAVRMLSHRRSSVIVNRAVGAGASMPAEAFSVDQARRMVASLDSCAILKSPWSSSGRGVVDTTTTAPEMWQRFADATIRRQGSVMVERRLQRLTDFALLFKIERDVPTPIGLSCFFLAHDTAYGGNIMAPQQHLASIISGMTSLRTLSATVASVSDALGNLLAESRAGYSGYAGIDMMVYRRADGRADIAPCIELNLRCTMGVLAMAAAGRLAVTVPKHMTVSPRHLAPPAPLHDLGGIDSSPFAIVIS